MKVSELKSQEDQLRGAAKSLRDLIAKFEHKRHLEENMHRIEIKHERIIQISRDIERKSGKIQKLKYTIDSYYDGIQRKKTPPKICDKEMQTDASVWQQYQVVKPVELLMGVDGTTQTGNLDIYLETTKNSQIKIFQENNLEIRQKEEKRKHLSLSASLEKLATDDKMSKKDYLRQLWKETSKERKEIDQMKQRGQQLKNNLETRIKNINTFVKRPWVQLDKKPLVTDEFKVVEDNVTKPEQVLDEKYSELKQLLMLSVRDKQARTLKTSDKANQTSELDSPIEVTEETQGASSNDEAEAHAELSTGLFGQIQHYCYSCCCHCSVCCQQGCPENNNNNKEIDHS